MTDSPSAPTTIVDVEGIGAVPLTWTELGAGRPYLLLHGGGGPASLGGFPELLSTAREARVVAPVHPGFGGTPRPDALADIAGLAALYDALLTELDLHDVTVVGNSIGGWIAAELALRGSDRISRLVLVDAVGIDVPGHPVADFFSLTMDQVYDLSYADPARFRVDPTSLPPAAQEVMAGNRASLAAYTGKVMSDTTLADRLGALAVPARVLWGDSDRICDVDYGRALAAAVPGAEFTVLPQTGHLPQLESPDQLLALLP